jgi:hypothetical protein
MDTTSISQLLADPTKSTLFLLLTLWAIPWKGVALWRATRHNQLYWFIAILVLNTFGIVEIIYLAFFQPKNKEQ